MTEILIGAKEAVPEKTSDLKDWYVFSDGAQMYIGKYADTTSKTMDKIKPAYSYTEQIQMDQRGNMGPIRIVVPIGMYASADSVEISVRSRRAIGDLDEEDKRAFLQMIHNAESARVQIRAARSGLSMGITMPNGGRQ